jgi:predicted nucleic acid-binding protein
MYLFDTNVLSELTKPTPNARVVQKLLACDRRLRFASEMTRYELRFGAALRPQGQAFWARIEAEILPRCDWLAIDADVSIRTADLSALLQRAGKRVEWADLVIAATALVHGHVVVTRNVKHFDRVDGLQVENWFPAE